MPETWMQVAVILTAVLPGFVFQVSRRDVKGPDPDERDFGVRVLRAVAASAVFAGIYAVALGPRIVTYVRQPATAFDGVQVISVGFLLLVVVVPWVAGRAIAYAATARWFAKAARFVVDKLRLRRQWDPTPSAWDFAFAKASPGWVRVRLADGSWVGGWFGYDSFATSFPEPQELYVETGYVISENGIFTGDESAPGGVIVNCRDAVLVDFIPDESHTDSKEE